LQQRAERRRGEEALALYEAASSAFLRATEVAETARPPVPADALSDAQFGLAESLQQQAETLLEVTSRMPDAALSPAVETQASQRAQQLFTAAAAAYESCAANGCSSAGDVSGFSNMRVDAAVNCGNVLASLADVQARVGDGDAVAAAVLSFSRAKSCYDAALAREEDPATLSNLADTLCSHGELVRDPGLFDRAFETYHRACQLSSSDNGDDLPGLLLNWGGGLATAAGLAANPAVSLRLLEEAVVRLRQSADFDRGDGAPHRALGEALLSKSERLTGLGEQDEAAAAAEASLEEFNAALRICRTDAEALAGAAEAHAQAARLAASRGDAEGAARRWVAAAGGFSAALSSPEKLGGYEERCDARYNWACCLARAGRVEEAAAAVRGLMAAGRVRPADVAADSDLAPTLPLLGLQGRGR
jgi:tetratricopeptide (TPR) repeat protein